MKKWEEKKRAQAHQKRVQSAKSTLSKNPASISSLKSPGGTSKDQSYEHVDVYPSPIDTTGSTRPSSSKLSDYFGFEKENLAQIPLYRLLKYFSLQQYAKALISRGYGYELTKLAALPKEKLDALMTDIKILPGHKVKFSGMVSQITSIYDEVIETEGFHQAKSTYSEKANTIMKPSTSQTTRHARPLSGIPKPQYNKPSSANPGMRRQPQTKVPVLPQPKRFDTYESRADSQRTVRKLQSLGLDYFSDSQKSLDDEFAKALNDILDQYQSEGFDQLEMEKPKQKTQSHSHGMPQKQKERIEPKDTGDLMTQVEKMYIKDSKPASTQSKAQLQSGPKPVLKNAPVEDKLKPKSGLNSTKGKPHEKVSFAEKEKEEKNVKEITRGPVKKAATDDLDIGRKGLEAKSKVLDLLDKKLDSNNLNKDNLNLEFKKIKDMYSSFEGATMTSTIANIDIEEMCFCFACAIQKHIEYFVSNVYPTYSTSNQLPKKELPLPKKEIETKPTSNLKQEKEKPQPIKNQGVYGSQAYDDENQYFVYKGQTHPKDENLYYEDEDTDFSKYKSKESNRYAKEENDEVVLSESGLVQEEEKNEKISHKNNEESEEVLYEETPHGDNYNEENFQDFLRESVRNSLLFTMGKNNAQQSQEDENEVINKYNIERAELYPVSAQWNIHSDKKPTGPRDSQDEDDEEPEEEIEDDEEEEEEEDEQKETKSYFSFEESQFVDVQLNAQELDLATRTKLTFEKTYNERNLTSEEINKRLGDTVANAVISNFCKNVMVTTKMEKEVIIVTLVYVERLMVKTNMFLNSLNWKRICFTAFIISSKIWDDESFENQHFAKVFPQYSIKEINELEKVFLEFIDYDLRVSGSEYAKYYFILRTFAEKSKKSFSLKALNVQTVRMLQSKAEETAKSLKEQYADPLNRTFA